MFLLPPEAIQSPLAPHVRRRQHPSGLPEHLCWFYPKTLRSVVKRERGDLACMADFTFEDWQQRAATFKRLAEMGLIEGLDFTTSLSDSGRYSYADALAGVPATRSRRLRALKSLLSFAAKMATCPSTSAPPSGGPSPSTHSRSGF